MVSYRSRWGLFGPVPVPFRPALVGAILFLVLISDVAFGREFSLKRGAENKVCQEVLRQINGPDASDDVQRFLAKLFPKPPLKKGHYFLKNKKGVRKAPVDVGEYDINNDGRLEILAFEGAMFRSDYGEQLLVFNAGEVDFVSQHPVFEYEQFRELNGIRSFVPWPYMAHNLFLVTIGLWRFDSVNYVALWDTRLHLPESATALVIAKYIGITIEPRDGWSTDRLDVVCKIM